MEKHSCLRKIAKPPLPKNEIHHLHRQVQGYKLKVAQKPSENNHDQTSLESEFNISII